MLSTVKSTVLYQKVNMSKQILRHLNKLFVYISRILCKQMKLM